MNHCGGGSASQAEARAVGAEKFINLSAPWPITIEALGDIRR